MKINNYCNTINKTTCFKSCSRKYFSREMPGASFLEKNEIYTMTKMFRPHINWKKHIDYIIEHFKNKPRVNIYSLGCSDGSEPYSYAIALTDRLSAEEKMKFLPIFASDIDNEVIEAASSGRINLGSEDINDIQKNIINTGKNSISKYVRKSYTPLVINCDTFPEYCPVNTSYTYKFTDNIKNSVIFSVSDALREIQNINDNGNSVVNISHVLGYCTEDYVKNVYAALGKYLNTGSLFVYDRMHNEPEYRKMLSDLGFFFPLKEEYIAEKI